MIPANVPDGSVTNKSRETREHSRVDDQKEDAASATYSSFASSAPKQRTFFLPKVWTADIFLYLERTSREIERWSNADHEDSQAMKIQSPIQVHNWFQQKLYEIRISPFKFRERGNDPIDSGGSSRTTQSVTGVAASTSRARWSAQESCGSAARYSRSCGGETTNSCPFAMFNPHPPAANSGVSAIRFRNGLDEWHLPRGISPTPAGLRPHAPLCLCLCMRASLACIASHHFLAVAALCYRTCVLRLFAAVPGLR